MQDAASSRRLLGATALMLLLTIAATLSFAAYRAHQSEMEEWEAQLNRTSLLLAEQTANEMAVAELLLDGMLERIAALGIDHEDELRRQLSTRSVFLELSLRKKALPQIDVAAIVDRQGRILNVTRTFPAPPVSLADRDYFIALRDAPARRSFISRPVRNRGNGEWTFYLSRRIEAVDGRFLGIVLVGVSSRRLSEFFSQIAHGADAAVSLCRGDFVALARWPRSAEGADNGDCRTGMRNILGGGRRPHGVAVLEPAAGAPGAGGLARMIAVRQVPNQSLLVAISAGETLYLRQWRSFALQLALVGMLCGAAVVACFALLRREMRRRDEAMQRQRALQAQADAANRAKGDFLAMISHEIRTPLTSVIGFAEQLEHARGVSEAAELGGIIARNGQTLLALIGDILDMSKMESGRLVLEQLPFAPRDALAAVTLLMAGQARQRGLAFDVEVAPDCPESVVGDQTRWRQILLNLVSNAIKFTERGSVTVQVWYEQPAQLLYCRVSDTGIGMGPEQVARLFEPFVQADGSIARRFGGSGLGLYLVRQLVHAMAGSLTVDTAPGAGARFTASARVAALAAAPETLAGRETGAAPPLKGTVLLVEDGEDNRRLIEALLRRRGLEVLCAADGAQGVDLALRARPDLVLMDIRMPVLDGLGAMRRMRAEGVNAPVVALTANVLPEDRRRYRLEGFADCLAKPVEREAFDLILALYLRRASARSSEPAGFPDLPEFADLHAAFIDGLEARLGQIRAALARADLVAAGQAAHTLRGSAASFGCPRTGAAAAEVELSCRSGELDSSMAAMAALDAAARSEAQRAFAGVGIA
jgi:hypothetical protein